MLTRNLQPAPARRIDIHSHILPRVDDGARHMDEALDMLRMAVADGTGTMVATPHGAQVDPERIRSAASTLRDEARRAGIDVEILVGCEVPFSATLADDYRAGKLLTINEMGYMLIEFSFKQTWSPLVHTSLYALQMAGVIPIVAHAERYPAIQDNPSILLEIVSMGIPIQVNAASLLGDAGSHARQTAELLLRANMLHILASDGHRRDSREPLLGEAFAKIEELAGRERKQWIEANAGKVIAGRTINLPEPDRSALKPKSFLRRVFGGR